MPILNFRDAGGGMKQPEDTRTAELPGLDVPAKRGRGRPRKVDALTPAERAKRYRDRQKAAAAEREARRPSWAYKHLKQHPSRQAPAIRYRGINGETWTGRGLMPRWVSAGIECGDTLQAMEQRAKGDDKLQRNTAKAAARWHGPNGEYWNGKGKQPIWFVAALARGITEAEMDAHSGRCFW